MGVEHAALSDPRFRPKVVPDKTKARKGRAGRIAWEGDEFDESRPESGKTDD